jgi:enoyl-CoA hydratase/3-hydroxyacyl-CoA dehydrogenase
MAVGIGDIETVAVVGAGQMGRGIGAVAALSGYEVLLNDKDEDQLVQAEEEIQWSYGKTAENTTTTEETEAAFDRLTFTRISSLTSTN